MEELKDKPADAGAEVEPGEGIRVGKFRLSKRALIFAAAGLLGLILIVSGGFVYRASARQKEAVQAQKRQQLEREIAAKDAEKLESSARAKELHRAHEEVLATPSALPGIFSSPARSALVEKPAAPATAVADPSPPSPPLTEQQAPAPKPEAKPEAKPAVEKKDVPAKTKTAAKASPAESLGVAAPNAAGGCALSGGKAEDYGKALGKCLEEFNRLEGRKASTAGNPPKSD